MSRTKVIHSTAMLLLLYCNLAFAVDISDPCSGPLAFLSIIDRPSIQDSACAVKNSKIVVEMGMQYTSLLGNISSWNYPQLEIRFGFPFNNELFILPSNYFKEDDSGFGPVIVGLKHEFFYNEKWIFSAETVFTVPSGNSTFGSAGLGISINGIASFEITSNIGLSIMLGISSQTLSAAEHGARYQSLNPDIVLSWQPKDKLQLFGEVYGQTNSAPGEGGGYNIDTGIQYLLTPTWEIDAVIAKKLIGTLGQFNYYVGAGMGFYF